MYTADQFQVALLELQVQGKLTDTALRILRAQYAAPNHDVTAPQLAALMNWTSFHSANLHYGKLGSLFASYLGPAPAHYLSGRPMGFSYLSTWWNDNSNWHWEMRPELAQALEKLGLVEQAVVEEFEPEFGELPEATYAEGAARSVTVNAYERNQAARRSCIEYHGTTCAVCNSDLMEMYGPIAEGFIHVHHLKPLSEVREGYTVNPRTDLVPVCPNCHAMLHRHTPPLTVQELRDRIQEAHR